MPVGDRGELAYTAVAARHALVVRVGDRGDVAIVVVVAEMFRASHQ